MRSDCFLALGLLAAAAAPAWATQSCGYRPDSCLKKAQACPRECSAFLRATVTPCPVIQTISRTATVTDSPTKTTVTKTVTATDSFSTTEAVSSISTVEDTLIVTDTITESDTTIISETTTVTTTLTTAPLRKRAIEARSYPVSARTSTCKPTTVRPTKVPPTASSVCRGTAQFSSACACAGIKPTTTTLHPKTTTVTKVATVRVTPKVTGTATETKRVSVTETETTVDLSTFSTTVTTEVVTDTAKTTLTTTEVETTTTTTTTTLPTCTAYKFVNEGSGEYSDHFVTGNQPDPDQVNYAYLFFTRDFFTANTFTLSSSGRVYDQVNVYGWVSWNSSRPVYDVRQMTNASQLYYNLPYLSCSVIRGGTRSPGTLGVLSCGIDGTPVTLATCPFREGNKLMRIFGAVPPECTAAKLAAIAVAVTSC